jgi:hypothetical protein
VNKLRDPDTRRKYFDWIADHLGLKEPDDWYKVVLSGILIATRLYWRFSSNMVAGNSIEDRQLTIFDTIPCYHVVTESPIQSSYIICASR